MDWTVLVTVLVTVLSGVLVFAASEWLRVIWLQPRQEFKQIQARIACALTMYACNYGNPLVWEVASDFQREEYSRISNETRQLAADLSGSLQLLTGWRRGIPSNDDILKAAGEIIGLSNRLFISEHSAADLAIVNYDAVQKVRGLLKLK